MSSTIETPTTKQRSQKSERIRRRRRIAPRELDFADSERSVLHPRDRPSLFNKESIRFRSPHLREYSNRNPSARQLSLENCFTYFGFVVAVSLITLCTIDMMIAWPWMRFSRLFDATFWGCGWLLIAMCYDTIKDQAASRRRT